MLTHFLSSVAALLLLLAAWITVQAVARRFAQQHPECGPYQEAGGGCGGGCGACAQPCNNQPNGSPNPTDAISGPSKHP
ncbi:hypothetical protein CKO18_06585 [Rhodoferax fermentans]|uniref:Chemotaxis protein n=1 Tax=Rhodoferax fermentans TaxID=28066 RepID=A0A1T1ARU8_RHOFE|nr:hypothetical protein [Rhodoferax fermentans]OOV06688.1 hypothetical protein RF819_08080 [Rhodoferax fermentans]